MLMVISMKVIGLMIKRMGMESISILTVLNMKVIGKKISSMVMEKRYGLMEHNLRGTI